jgi:hypothetical protein
MHGYCKCSEGTFITVHYNSLVEASVHGWVRAVYGPSYRFIIIDY